MPVLKIKKSGKWVEVWGSVASGTGTLPIRDITIKASAWTGNASPYTQVVSIDGVTKNSMVELRPTMAQIELLRSSNTSFTAENNDGVVTIYATGHKPKVNYTISAAIITVV